MLNNERREHARRMQRFIDSGDESLRRLLVRTAEHREHVRSERWAKTQRDVISAWVSLHGKGSRKEAEERLSLVLKSLPKGKIMEEGELLGLMFRAR